MSEQVATLKRLVATIASGLETLASAPRSEATPVTLQESLAALETLLTALREADLLRHGSELPTIAKLEHQYGRALARVIAAVGGLPILTDERSATLTSLLMEDQGARAALRALDPRRDAEILETLYDLFVPSRVSAMRSNQLARERSSYVIGAATPGAPAAEADEPDPDLAPEHHVSGVHRVERNTKSRKR